MPLDNFEQPEMIEINASLRLRKYDGNYESFLSGYTDPVVYQNSEGIFDDNKIPDLNYVKGMCEYLSNSGELYYIEIKENNTYKLIGDITIRDENLPIAIWEDAYRGKGIGTLAMQTAIARLKMLGYQRIKGSTVYKWNIASQKMHETLGFVKIKENGNDIIYNLELV